MTERLLREQKTKKDTFFTLMRKSYRTKMGMKTRVRGKTKE